MLIAFLVAAGVMFPAIFTVSSDTGDAFAAQADQTRDQVNTAIAVEPIDDSGGDIVVAVDNEGTTSLTITDTDLLVNGEFVQPDGTVVDDGETERDETDIWLPGTTLELTVSETTLSESGIDDVERVKVVTETGIADATEEGS
ncbi:flagellin [Natronobacterium gregoryi SP2]|nr:flagellin [Natronobacterium gregoryi SP2]